MNKLKIALSSFLKDDEIENLVTLLEYSVNKKRVSYEEIEEIIKDDPENVLFTANEWGLIYPVKTFKSTSWEDRVLFAMPGEIYEIPNIIRYLIENALNTGKWDIKSSITDVFREIGEPKWSLMPELVEEMKNESIDYIINAQQIKRICIKLGLSNKMGPLIAELKAGGIISPKLGSFMDVFKAHSPIYELNRSLFV